MKRSYCSIEAAALFAWLVMAAAVPAQQPAEKSADKSGEASPATEGEDSARKPVSEEGQARRMIGVLTKLREKMEAKLNLSDAQKRTIRPMFEDHLKELKATAAKKSPAGSKTDKADKGDEMAELREKLKEAQQNNDRDGVNGLRKQMRELRRERRTGIQKGTSQFLKKIEEKLEDEQKEPFGDIVKEFGLDMDSASAEVSVQQLFRAVLNPEVGLTQEQKMVVVQHMKTSVESMDPDTRESRDLDEISGQLRADLRKALSPEQWTKVEEILKAEVESKKSEHKGDRRKPANESEKGGKSDE